MSLVLSLGYLALRTAEPHIKRGKQLYVLKEGYFKDVLIIVSLNCLLRKHILLKASLNCLLKYFFKASKLHI